MTPVEDMLFAPPLQSRRQTKRLRPSSRKCGSAAFPFVVDVYDWLYRAPGRQTPTRHAAVRTRRQRTAQDVG